MGQYWGETAGLLTALCWTFTGLSFEFASKRIGSFQVNIIRLFLAFFFIGIYTYFTRGFFLPVDATAFHWGWLALSGIIGFTIGDLLLFKGFETIGARLSLLIMSFSPPVAALIGWVFLGESLIWKSVLGMCVTITGIAIVILERKKTDSKDSNKKLKVKYPVKGLLYAFGGSVGQAVGLVLSKYGMQDYNAFAASQIRVLAGLAGFIILFSIMRRWSKVASAVTDKKAMAGVFSGSVFGPFLGVSFSLIAVKYTQVGIASTIMSISPVIILPFSYFLFKEKFGWSEIIGAIVTVTGVSLFFL